MDYRTAKELARACRKRAEAFDKRAARVLSTATRRAYTERARAERQAAVYWTTQADRACSLNLPISA